MPTRSNRLVSSLLLPVLLGLASFGIGCVQSGGSAGPARPSPPAPQPEPAAPQEVETSTPEPATQPAPKVVNEPPAPAIVEPALPDWVLPPLGPSIRLPAIGSIAGPDSSIESASDWDLELALQSGHPGDAYVAYFTPDGRYLATGGGEGSDAAVRIWNLSSSKELRYMPQPYGIEYIEFSPDGSKFRAIGGLFEIETGLRLHGADSTEAFGDGRVDPWYTSPDWTRIVATVWDRQTSRGVLNVMDYDSKETVVAFELDGVRASNVHFAKHAPRFAVRLREAEGKGRELRVYDWESKQLVATLPGEDASLIELSPDGRHVLLADKSRRVSLVDLEHPESTVWQLDGIPVARIALPKGAGFFGDGSQLIVGDSSGNSLLLLDSSNGKVLRQFVAKDPICALAIDTKNGRLAGSFGTTFAGVASASGEPHGIRLWDLATGEALKDMRDDSGSAYEFLDFSPDGQLLASAGIQQTPALWNVAEGTRTRRLRGDVVEPENAEFHPNDRYLSILGVDARLRILDLATARTLATVENCWEASWDPSGDWLGIIPARRKRTQDGAVLLWNLERAKVERVLQSPGIQPTAFAFDPTGKRVAAVSWYSGRVLVWDRENSQPIWEGKVINPGAITFSPDGKLVAAGAMSTDERGIGATIFNAETGEVIVDLIGDDVRSLDFSRDGRWLAAADNSNATPHVLVFDTTTWEQVGKFPGHDWIVSNLAFSVDGNRIASADMSGKVLVHDRKSGSLTKELRAHGFKISDLSLSAGGETLASTSMDGRTILWDTHDFSKVATVIIGRGEDTVITLPGGHYTMSPQAHHLVAFADGMTSYPFEQFDLRLNRPDLIVRRLGRSSADIAELFKRAWSKRIRRMGFSEESLAAGGEVPTLSILARDELPISQAERELSFRIQAQASSPLERINLFVNDVPVWGTNGRDISAPSSSEYEGQIQVRLSAGRNKVQVSCLNQAGFESLRSTFEVTCSAPESQPDAYVLAIGVSEYLQDEYSLVYAAKDARDITAAFESNGLYGKVHSKLLTDSAATRDSILAAREFLMQADVDDQVVLFVAGHGVLSDDLDYFFGTHDIDFASPAEHGLSYADLEGLVDGIPSRKKLVLMDTCHSGELEPEGTELLEVSVASGVKQGSTRGLRVVKNSRTEDLSELLGTLFTDLRRGTGAVVVTSSSGTEYSYEDEKWANGVFSYAVLEGLRDRRAGKDDTAIRASQLMEYVGARVTELTGGMQTPTMRRDNLELDFPIWR